MKRFLRWLRELWWARQRAVDLEILWPSCKELAPDLDRARACFAVHAFNDPCWYEYYGHDKLVEVISALT